MPSIQRRTDGGGLTKIGLRSASGNFITSRHTSAFRSLSTRSHGVKRSARAAQFDQVCNIIVQGPPATNFGESVQSSWKLPHPKEIFTLQRVTKLPGSFTGTIPDGIQVPHAFGAVQVLTFDLDGSLPSVEGPREWVPETREFVNLHVFAEESDRWTMKSALQHPTEEFVNLMKLTRFGNTLGEFDFNPAEIPLVEPSTHVPEGMRRIELLSLPVRPAE